MKILYAVQGTGNGHVARARDIIPVLQKKASVDILISGTQADIDLPFAIKYNFKGLGFVFGKKGGVDILETYRKSRLREFLSEIKKLPVGDYDLVISDFEPVSSWACYFSNKSCIGLSHQCAVLDKNAPQPKHVDQLGRAILKTYAPASAKYGFHFQAYGEKIFTPVIRQEIRSAALQNLGHYTVYLPSYGEKRIIKTLQNFPDQSWQVFSKHNKKESESGNVRIFPISNELFIKSMASSEGVLCGAGFETPAEAIYMKKKLLVIPMKNQFEQHCNAAALKKMGIPVMKSLKPKHLPVIDQWLSSDQSVSVNYPDCTESILDQILQAHAPDSGNLFSGYAEENDNNITVKRIKQLTLKNILFKMSN